MFWLLKNSKADRFLLHFNPVLIPTVYDTIYIYIYIYIYICIYIYKPRHEKMSLMSYVNNKGADQPAHPHSLISAFVVRCLDSVISLDLIAEISRL